MKKLILALAACALFLVPHRAHARSIESCKQGACYGFGPPQGAASTNGYIYQDVSQSPTALYCPKGGVWTPCGGSGGGDLTSFIIGNLAPLFTAALGGSSTTAPAIAYTLSNAGQNFFLAGPATGTAGAPSYRHHQWAESVYRLYKSQFDLDSAFLSEGIYLRDVSPPDPERSVSPDPTTQNYEVTDATLRRSDSRFPNELGIAHSALSSLLLK